MSLTHRQEGAVLLIIALGLLIVLMTLVSGAILYSLPNVLVIAGATFLATLCGAIIPKGIGKVFHPELDVKDPYITRIEEHSMGFDPILVRLPVTAKRASINDVYAEVLSVVLFKESDHNQNHFVNGEFLLRGDRKLFWAEHYKPHTDDIHSKLEKPKEVLRHMQDKHLSAAGIIDELDEGDVEYVNICLKIEGLPETFLADSIGTAGGKYSDAIEFCQQYDSKEDTDKEFTNGEFECKVKIGGEGVESKEESIIFTTGPSVLDLGLSNWATLKLSYQLFNNTIFIFFDWEGR